MKCVHLQAVTDPELDAACEVLRAGGVVAAATESSYGLLVDAGNARALDLLFQVKARDTHRGIGLMVPGVNVWRLLVSEPPADLVRLAQRFWPGPLSIVAEAASGLDPRLVVAGNAAVRVPGPSPAAQLVSRFGGALTATSANLTGEPACLTADELRTQLVHALPWLHILEGDAPGGSPSTFVGWDGAGLHILRAGALSAAQLEAALRDI